jgi:hypothetical protein
MRATAEKVSTAHTKQTNQEVSAAEVNLSTESTIKSLGEQGAFKVLTDRLEASLDPRALEVLDATLQDKATPENIRQELSQRIETFANNLQLRSDGYVQDYTNAVNMVDNQVRMFSSVVESSPDYATKVLGNIVRLSGQLENYQEYLTRKNILESDPTVVEAHSKLQELGLSLTNDDVIGLLPNETRQQISDLIIGLKELGSSLAQEDGSVKLSTGSVAVCADMRSLLEQARGSIFST